ncbi:MAG TPA: DUF190 domain-containing protein [Aldersonia sp.]
MRTKEVLRLSIMLDQDETWHHRPLYQEIVARAKDAGMAGASVWRGVEGFGASSTIHTTRILDLADHLPILIVIVDEPDRIRTFADDAAELLAKTRTTVDPAEMLQIEVRP